ARTTVFARSTASRLSRAAAALPPISVASFFAASRLLADRTTDSPPAASSRPTAPPMFPIPMIAVVMSLLLEQPLGDHDLNDLLDRLHARPIPRSSTPETPNLTGVYRRSIPARCASTDVSGSKMTSRLPAAAAQKFRRR